MKLPLFPLSLAMVFVCLVAADAQSRRSGVRAVTGVVIDEGLSVLRAKPSLFADPLQRMRRGRRVQILAASDSDGVRFFRVKASNGYIGWIQSDAVFGKFRPTDDERLARMVHATGGFEQVELANAFLHLYPTSQFRPPVLLLLGDLLEAAASKLSRDAGSRLNHREMAASGAPVHSYYLNFNMLDRYRRAGATFLFNNTTRSFHYDGASWKELVRKHPSASEASEARKRLESLSEKLETKVASN